MSSVADSGNAEPTTRKVAWSRRVYHWRGKKFVIVTCIDLPRPRVVGSLLITNRAQLLALYGQPHQSG